MKKESSNSNKIILVLCAVVTVFLLFFFLLRDKSYIVKFNVDGGTIVTEQKIQKGKNPSIPEEPTKENYIFVGWLYNGEPFDFSVPLEGDVLLTANWVAVEEGVTKYVARFDSKGGTTIINQVVESGDSIVKPCDPEKPGYKFLNWTLNGEVYNFSLPVESNITLEAEYYETSKNENSENNENDEVVNAIKPNAPLLLYPTGSDMYGYGEVAEDGYYLYDLFVNTSDFSLNESEPKYSVDGFEVFEKNNDGYVSVGKNELGGAVAVEIEPGTKRIFVAKVYISDEKGNYTYSDYSKELVIDKTIIKKPKLSYEKQMLNYRENGVYLVDFGVAVNDFYIKELKSMTVDGFEVFEKNGANYVSLGSNEVGGAVPVEIDAGSKKTFVARSFVLNKSKKKVYSDYSNELVIDTSNIKTPTLFSVKGMGLNAENGVYLVDFGVNRNDFVISNSNMLSVDGFELYEKIGGTYKSLGSNEVGGAVPVEIEVGQKKTYVARAFLLNKNKKKIYSGYSNEIIIDKTTVKVPTLSYEKQMLDGCTVDECIVDFGVLIKDYYNEEFNVKIADGFELYEKNGSTYKSLGSNEIGGAVVANFEIGTKKTYVARAFVVKKDGTKLYSGYSSEVVIDKSSVKAPTLFSLKGMGLVADEGVYFIDFGVDRSDYVVPNSEQLNVNGFELYEKNGSTYKSLGSNEVGGAVAVEIEVGQKKTFVARTYVFDKNNKKIFSNYSNEIIIDKSSLKAPTLSYEKQMLDGCTESICIVDFGVLIKDYYNEEFNVRTVDGFELFEKTGNTYKSLGSNEVGGAVVVEIEPSAKKTIVAKVFVLKKDGTKLYSNYSNEVILQKK